MAQKYPRLSPIRITANANTVNFWLRLGDAGKTPLDRVA
jgi:hypothetical protein